MGKHVRGLMPHLPHRSLWIAMVILTVAAHACN
jgi:hypothetical protein